MFLFSYKEWQNLHFNQNETNNLNSRKNKYFEAKYQQISQHSASLGSWGCLVFDILNLIDFISK